MKVQIEKLPESKIKLKIEVSPEKVKEYLEKASAEISNHIKVSGFRSGHVPYEVVEKNVGSKAIHEEAIRLLVPRVYVKAIMQEKIMAVGRPDIKVTKFAPGNPAEFEMTVAIIPEIHLGDYKDIKIEKQEIKVELSEIDEMLDNLRKKDAILKPKEGVVEKGDWVEIDFDGFKKGVLLEKLKSRHHPVITGDNILLPDFEKNIYGMRAGEEKEFDMNFPLDYFEKSFAGEKVHFKLKLNKVQKVELPNLDNEFVKKITGGTDKTLEELKTDIEIALKKQKEHDEKIRIENEVINQVIEKAKVDIPDLLIEEEIEDMKKDLINKLESRGLKLERYLEHLGKTEDQLKEEYKEEAERRIRMSLVLNKISDEECISVTDEECDREVEKTKKEAEKNGRDQKFNAEEVKKYIKTVLRNRKTLDRLLEYATNKK